MLSELKPLTEKHNISIVQLVIAWALHQRVHSLPCRRKNPSGEENVKGGDVMLSEDDLKQIRVVIGKYFKFRYYLYKFPALFFTLSFVIMAETADILSAPASRTTKCWRVLPPTATMGICTFFLSLLLYQFKRGSCVLFLWQR